MTTLDNQVDKDLKDLNFQFLMILRECARHHPLDAMWKFGVSDDDIKKISAMSINDVQSLSVCSRSLFTVIPITDTPSHVTPSILASLIPSKTQFQLESL